MSIADIVAALWAEVMNDPGTDSPERDRFVLGKGHASLALYCALHWLDRIDSDTLGTFCGEGSLLGVHPEAALGGVDVSTGSLGQGLSIGLGNALALHRRGSKAHVWVLLSDAECNEGQVWEAAQFAAHHGLDNLSVVVDWNGLQALGHTRNILDNQLPAMWEAFGWESHEIDGHDADGLVRAFSAAPQGKPRAFVARTVLGKGVSFMEDKVEWHYFNLTPELGQKALEELAAADGGES